MKAPVVSYASSEVAWAEFDQLVIELIRDEGARVTCEVGGGANPTLPMAFVERSKLEYVLIDVSEVELAKAPAGYTKVRRDIQEPDPMAEGRYDLVFSKMLAEHVRDGEMFHRNVLQLLRPGGVAIHFFPTLYAPPFVVNRLLPEGLGERVLHLVQSGRERSGRRGKFPAFYSWCRGPTAAQISRLEGLGYEVVRYTGFFGHSGYYKKSPLLERLHLGLASWLVEHPLPYLTSFAWVVLRKLR